MRGPSLSLLTKTTSPGMMDGCMEFVGTGKYPNTNILRKAHKAIRARKMTKPQMTGLIYSFQMYFIEKVKAPYTANVAIRGLLYQILCKNYSLAVNSRIRCLYKSSMRFIFLIYNEV